MGEGTDSAREAWVAIPTSEQNPLARLTWFGVRRPRNAAAANTRPIRRFTNREYAGVPADGFCARDNCSTVSRRVMGPPGLD